MATIKENKMKYLTNQLNPIQCWKCQLGISKLLIDVKIANT